MVDGMVKINWLSAYHVYSQMRTVKLSSGSIQILKKISKDFLEGKFFEHFSCNFFLYINAKLQLVVSSLHTQWETDKQFCSGAGPEGLVHYQ